MFDRHLIKVTDCSNGKFDVSSLQNLKINKRIINNSPVQIDFKDVDVKVTGVDGCGKLVIKPGGLIKQEPTADSTRDGRMIMKQNKIGAYNILEHKEEVLTDAQTSN